MSTSVGNYSIACIVVAAAAERCVVVQPGGEVESRTQRHSSTNLPTKRRAHAACLNSFVTEVDNANPIPEGSESQLSVTSRRFVVTQQRKPLDIAGSRCSRTRRRRAGGPPFEAERWVYARTTCGSALIVSETAWITHYHYDDEHHGQEPRWSDIDAATMEPLSKDEADIRHAQRLA